DELLEELRAPGKRHTRRRVMAALGGGTLLAVGGAGAWWWNTKRHHDPAAAALPWYRDGLAALHYGSYHKASKALTQAVAIDPSYTMAHAYLAEAWYELDYLERAKDELIKAMGARASLPELESARLDAIQQTVMGEFKSAAEK